MPPIAVPPKSPVYIAAFTLPLSFIFVVCIAHASAETSSNTIPEWLMKNKSVNNIIEVAGSIKAITNSDIPPIIPPRIIKFFLPYFPKKSTVGPYTNFITQGIEDIPATRVVIEIDIFFSVKNKTIIIVANANIKPSEKYRLPKRIYFRNLFSVISIRYIPPDIINYKL